MIFVAKGADFSLKKIGTVDIVYEDTESSGGAGEGKVTMISITSLVSELLIGESFQFEATAFPEDADNKKLVWTCSPPSVATIDSNTGLLTAKSIGTVTVTASATDGGGAKASVHVFVNYSFIETTNLILRRYNRIFTQEEKIAFDTMLRAVGAEEENSIYSKIDVMLLPCLASNIEEAFLEIKSGIDLMNLPNAAGANEFRLNKGNILAGSNANANIPINTTQRKANDFSCIVGGEVETIGGSSELVGNNFLSNQRNKIGLCGLTGYQSFSDLSGPRLRAFSISPDKTMIFAPQNSIVNTDISGLINFLEKYSTYKTPRFLRLKTQFYCFAIGQPMTSDELETLIIALNKLFVEFNTNTAI